MEEEIKEVKTVKENKKIEIIIHLCTAVGTILILIFIYYAMKNNLFTSEEALANFLKGVGIFGPILFLFIQFVQVIIPIVPGGISTAIGVLVFGPVQGFIYNYVGIVLGSIVVFFISRKYGIPLITKMFGKKLIHKYIGWLDKEQKFEKMFALAIFLPIAPDDFLCYLAGVTKISVKKYILIIVLLKPFTIIAYSFSLVYLTKLLTTIF